MPCCGGSDYPSRPNCFRPRWPCSHGWLRIFPTSCSSSTMPECRWEQSAEGLSSWEAALKTLAGQPNVNIKLSGFGLYGGRDWKLESIGERLLRVIDIFGAERCMLGRQPARRDTLFQASGHRRHRPLARGAADASGGERHPPFQRRANLSNLTIAEGKRERAPTRWRGIAPIAAGTDLVISWASPFDPPPLIWCRSMDLGQPGARGAIAVDEAGRAIA